MREIKFRAWDKVTNCMLTEKDVWKLYLNGGVSIDGVWATDNLILQQYTGLKDKNGVDIYEGDICASPDDCYRDSSKETVKGKITWDAGDACFSFDDGSGRDWMLDINEGLEVIGNIYENPELLEDI